MNFDLGFTEIIVGQPIINHSDVLLTTHEDSLQIQKCTSKIKIPIILENDVKIKSHLALSVPVKINTNGVLLFSAYSQSNKNEKYSIPSCIINKNKNMVVVINNNSQELFKRKGRILGRSFQIDLPTYYSKILQIKSVSPLNIAEVKFIY